MKIAVVGGGPSGAMCAWACIQYGHDVTVLDQNLDSIGVGQNHGVFALLSSCDLYLTQKVELKIGVIGGKGLDQDDINALYAENVYGTRERADEVSIGHYSQFNTRVAYNHAEAYQQIMDILGEKKLRKYKVSNFTDILILLDEFELIFVTIPATILWPSAVWPWTQAYIYHAPAPERDAFMIYNVNKYVPWYRCSAIFGNFSMEYVEQPVDEKKYVRVRKVLDPPITPKELCTLPNTHFVGRYGAWEKTTLTEDVYYHTLQVLDEHKRGQARRNIQATV